MIDTKISLPGKGHRPNQLASVLAEFKSAHLLGPDFTLDQVTGEELKGWLECRYFYLHPSTGKKKKVGVFKKAPTDMKRDFLHTNPAKADFDDLRQWCNDKWRTVIAGEPAFESASSMAFAILIGEEVSFIYYFLPNRGYPNYGSPTPESAAEAKRKWGLVKEAADEVGGVAIAFPILISPESCKRIGLRMSARAKAAYSAAKLSNKSAWWTSVK